MLGAVASCAGSPVILPDDEIAAIAPLIAPARDVLYLGRGPDYPLALEGALKLKEISYIHAEGYASGEMKHGPIALIDESVPVIEVHLSNPARRENFRHTSYVAMGATGTIAGFGLNSYLLAIEAVAHLLKK